MLLGNLETNKRSTNKNILTFNNPNIRGVYYKIYKLKTPIDPIGKNVHKGMIA